MVWTDHLGVLGHLPNSKPSCGHLPTLLEEVFLRLEFEFGPKQPVAAQPTAWSVDGKACAGDCVRLGQSRLRRTIFSTLLL